MPSRTAGWRAKAVAIRPAHTSRRVTRRIVPMNHLNKDKTPSAESGEGRPPVKENVGQPNKYLTPGGKGVLQGLAGVRKAAKALSAMASLDGPGHEERMSWAGWRTICQEAGRRSMFAARPSPHCSRRSRCAPRNDLNRGHISHA